MFCGKCGAKLEDGAQFCPECGAKVEMPGQVPPAQGMPTASVPMPGIASRAVYNKGCLSQAFEDMTKTPGVLPRVVQISFLPAVIFVVSTIAFIIPVLGPILGSIGYIFALVSIFCGSGYAIEWGRELSRGRGFNVSLPLLRTSTLSLGFFSGILVLVLPLITWIPLFFFGFGVGIIGSAGAFYMGASYGTLNFLLLLFIVFVIGVAVLNVLVDMFAHAAVMHLAVTGRVESAFSFGKVFKAYKSHLGKLFCAVELPSIMVGIATALILLILGAVLSAISGAIFYNSYSYGYYGGSPFAALFTGLIPMIIFLAIAGFIISIEFVFVNMLKYRAVGHWAARYAPEWVSEGDEDFVLLGRKNANVSVNVNYQPPAR